MVSVSLIVYAGTLIPNAHFVINIFMQLRIFSLFIESENQLQAESKNVLRLSNKIMVIFTLFSVSHLCKKSN